MICKYCGAPVPMGMSSCPYCGTLVEKKAEQTDSFDDETSFAYNFPMQEPDPRSEAPVAPAADQAEETVFAGGAPYAEPVQRPVREDPPMQFPQSEAAPAAEPRQKAAKKEKKQGKKAAKKMSTKDKIVNGILLVILAVIVFFLLQR